MIGGIVLAFVGTLLVGNFVVQKEKSIRWNTIGNDFLVFYTAGTLVKDKHAGDLYDLAKSQAVEDTVARSSKRDVGIGPIWNPPFFAWMLSPLARFDFDTALLWWYAIGASCLVASFFILTQFIPERAGTGASLFLVLMALVSEPLIKAFAHGQNTFISLAILTGTVALWRARRAFLAGLVAGVLFYKPQLGAIVAVMLGFTLGWRAMLGIAITLGAMISLNQYFLPGTLAAYFHQVPLNLRSLQMERPYQWDRHVTFVAFWRMIFQGNGVGPTWIITKIFTLFSTLAVAAGLIWGWRRQRPITDHRERARSLDQLIAATIVCSPLLMPFYFDYDLTLLMIPAVLVGRDFAMGNRDLSMKVDRWLPWIWAIMYVGTYFNTVVARTAHVSISVIFVATLAGLMIRRIGRPGFVWRNRKQNDDHDSHQHLKIGKNHNVFAFPEAA